MSNEKLDLIKNFGKMFTEKSFFESEEISENERIGFMDQAKVCMIIPKRAGFKKFIENNFNVTEEKIPTLGYTINKTDVNKIIRSKYSSYYLKILLELSKHYESIVLKIHEDYPLTAECDDFIFILAMRVDNDMVDY